MNKTTENLWKALKNYPQVEHKKVSWKLIYDPKSGKPLSVTTQETTQTYIEIDKEEANRYPHQDPRVSIVDGKIVRKIKKLNLQETPNKLYVFPDDKGNIATDAYNMLLINNSGNNRWKYD
jgi:hypothetical protein